MKKISFKKLFTKSKSGKKKESKLLLVLLIILVVVGAVYLGYPYIFPNNSVKTTVTPVIVKTPITTPTPTVTPETEATPTVTEKTEFEIEMEMREQGYKNRIFVYEPYEPPSNRNPFQKVSNLYFSEEAVIEEEGEEGKIIRFPKPELPPGTKLSGIIDSGNKRVAIIVMNEMTYVASLFDIISERYIVKEIKKDEVTIEISGYDFSLKIGGEDTSDESKK